MKGWAPQIMFFALSRICLKPSPRALAPGRVEVAPAGLIFGAGHDSGLDTPSQFAHGGHWLLIPHLRPKAATHGLRRMATSMIIHGFDRLLQLRLAPYYGASFF